jgi:hypothetical protein
MPLENHFLSASRFQRQVYLTNICHLWTLATSSEQCTCTNIGHLSVSYRLSVNVTKDNVITGLSLLTKSRLVVAFPRLVILDKSTSDLCADITLKG